MMYIHNENNERVSHIIHRKVHVDTYTAVSRIHDVGSLYIPFMPSPSNFIVHSAITSMVSELIKNDLQN